jgi:ankyrin repeat protein
MLSDRVHSRVFVVSLGVAIWGTSGALAGDMYRCDRNGEVLLSDQVCGADARAIHSPPLAKESREDVAVLREQRAMLCFGDEYNKWFRGQQPKPSRAEQQAEGDRIDLRCRALHQVLPPKLPPSPKPGTPEALFDAVEKGDLPALTAYLDAGGDPNLRKTSMDRSQKTPRVTPLLNLAVNFYHEALARVLIERGAHANSAGSNGYTTLHAAANNGMVALMELLLQKGVPITAQTAQGYTPLHSAIHGNKIESARLLIKHGALVDAVDFFDGTPLHHAIIGNKRNQCLPLIRLLLEAGADPNTRNVGGDAALHAALRGTRPPSSEVMTLLLDAGADPNAKNSKQETPRQLAERYGHREASAQLGAVTK